MDQELLKKARRRRMRRWGILAVIICLVAASLLGLKLAGGKVALPIGEKSATVEISCDQLAKDPSVLKKKDLLSYIPKDGVILAKTPYKFEKGATVYDALADLCKAKHIHMESKFNSTYQSYYVKGIGHLYEFDAGKRSGWMFQVNGEVPEYGAGKVELHQGDHVRWYYVVDYTKKN